MPNYIHRSPSSKTCSARNRFDMIQLLTKRVLWILKITEAITKATGCSLQTDGKALLLKDIHISFNKEVTLVST